MSDWSDAAIEAAQLLDDLEAEYGEDVEIGRVMLIVEVSGDIGSDEEWTAIHYRSNESKRWIQAGLLEAALQAVHASSVPRNIGDDGDEEDDD